MNETTVITLACELAEYAAARDADVAIERARTSRDDPIVFITPNSHMPPLRAFERAEDFWQASGGALGNEAVWEAYVESFERALGAANVYMAAPEYDNALYVVDLARFEHVDDEDRDDEDDTLSGEWRPIEREAEFYADIKRAPGDIEYAVPLLAEEGDFLGAAHVATQIVHRMRRESYADPQVLKVYAKSELPRSET